MTQANGFKHREIMIVQGLRPSFIRLMTIALVYMKYRFMYTATRTSIYKLRYQCRGLAKCPCNRQAPCGTAPALWSRGTRAMH